MSTVTIRRAPTERSDDVLGAAAGVLVLLHGAAEVVVGDVVPPDPRPAARVGDAVDAELAQVLHHHVLAVVPRPEVLLRVRRAVPATTIGIAAAVDQTPMQRNLSHRRRRRCRRRRRRRRRRRNAA